MAGQPYQAGGIRVTTEATRAAGEELLEALTAARRREGLRAGITHAEIKSGYGLDVPTERRSAARSPAASPTTSPSSAPTSSRPSTRVGRIEYVELVCGEMLDACAPLSRWIDVFCERGAFDADQCRAVLEAGRGAGLGMRVHGNQLGEGPGVALAVELGAASVDHCTYLSDADVEALAGGRDRGHLPPGDRLLDPPALP